MSREHSSKLQNNKDILVQITAKISSVQNKCYKEVVTLQGLLMALRLASLIVVMKDVKNHTQLLKPIEASYMMRKLRELAETIRYIASYKTGRL